MEIKEIELLTDSIEETAKFYSELLGFETVYSDSQIISFQAGKSLLTFKQSDNSQPVYHFAFTIPGNKLEEAIKWTSTKVELLKIAEDNVIADFDAWNAKSFYFYDNNRNILEFITRYDLNFISEEIFDINSIVSISEIGIVTDEPLTYAENLIRDCELGYFTKSVKRDAFVVLGNDYGLFIIVKTGRNWYPTDIPAKKCTTKIKYEINNKTKESVINDNNPCR